MHERFCSAHYFVEKTDVVFVKAEYRLGAFGFLANGVVESQFGYHIIQVEEKEAAGKKSLADAKTFITQFIEQQKMKIRI